jgi:hypothetical protein
MGDDSKPTADPPKARAPTGVSPASGGEELAKGMEGIRSLLQRTGAALGAGAAALLAALGLTQAYELFPLPENLQTEQKVSMLIGALLGAGLALGGTAWLASRFFSAQRRILLDSAGLQDESNKAERDRATVKRVLDEHAREENAHDLLALELRALRLQRIARRRGEGAGQLARAASEAIQAESDRVQGVVSIALTRAAAVLLEKRASDVFKPGRTAAALVVALTGLILLFGVGDYADGQRELVELRKTCSEAKPGAKACETVVPPSDLAAAAAAGKEAKRRARAKASNAIKDYRPRGDKADRAGQAARLVDACQTRVSASAPSLTGEELGRAVGLCVAIAAD